jgi:hypothetical protein
MAEAQRFGWELEAVWPQRPGVAKLAVLSSADQGGELLVVEEVIFPARRVEAQSVAGVLPGVV